MSTAAEAVKELGDHESLSEVSVQEKFSTYTRLMKVGGGGAGPGGTERRSTADSKQASQKRRQQCEKST